MLQRVCLLGVAALLFGCSGAKRARDTESLQVAVFLHQIDLFLPPSDFTVTPVACLATYEGAGAGRLDASPALLRKVSALHVVRPASACEPRAEGGVVVREGGAAAALFMVGPIRWVSPDEAQVKARHHVSLSRQGQAVYRVVRQGKTWHVLGAILEYAPF